MRQIKERKDKDAFLSSHLSEVGELNYKVFKVMSLYSMLTNLLLCVLSLIPHTVLSAPDFRTLFCSSGIFFCAAYCSSCRKRTFFQAHATVLLYTNLLCCLVFFFILDRRIAFHRGTESPYTLILGFLMVQAIIITDKWIRRSTWTVISALASIVLALFLKPFHIALNDIINCTVLGLLGINIGEVTQTYFLNYIAMKVREKDIELKAAEEASKAKSEFLALISHEVRTPLNAVVNMNEMILRESSDTNALGYAKNIKQACGTLASLINDILDFSKLNSGEVSLIPVEYELDTMLNDMLNMINPRMEEKGLRFVVIVPEETPNRLIGDDLRIKQCVMNLLSNAVKYTDTGNVSLSVDSWQADDDDQCIMLTFTVADTGIGIKEEDLGRIAHPFERLDELKNRSIEGSGLGLAIVQGILQKMNSSLRIRSTYGSGSEFSFTIRQPVALNVPIGKYNANTRRFPGNGVSRYGRFIAPTARILIVDDLQMNLDVLCSLLKCTQMQIDTATSAKRAIQLINENHYDVVFIDHRMPVIDGIETLHIIQLLDIPDAESTRYIALTANAAKDSRQMYLDEGFHDYLPKPVDPEELEQMLIWQLPEGLVRLTGDLHTEQSSGDDESFMQAYGRIPGADRAVAMNYCKNTGSLKQAVKTFSESLPENLKTLEQSTAAGDFKSFALTAHSLKTELRLMGFTDASQDAAKLEALADSRDADGISPILQPFTRKLQEIGEQFTELTGKTEVLPEEQYKEALSALKECASTGDLRTAANILAMLEEYELPVERRQLFTQIGQSVRNKNTEMFRKLLENLNPEGGITV